MYKFFIFPIETGYRYLYQVLYAATGSYGVSLVLMSLLTTVLITPFMKYASRVQMKERDIQDVLRPQMEKINEKSVGAERHERISRLYRKYAYHPIYSIRSALGVFLQVPFLMGAYYMVRHFSGIIGESFGAIADLSRPDGLLRGINLLPVLMTAINMISACITPGFGKREIRQAWIIALLFLALLYSAPSALLVFWTCNNLWGMFVNVKSFAAQENNTPLQLLRRLFFETVRFLSPSSLSLESAEILSAGFLLTTLQALLALSLNMKSGKQVLLALCVSFFVFLFSTFIFIARYRKALFCERPVRKILLFWGPVLIAVIMWFCGIGGWSMLHELVISHISYFHYSPVRALINILRTVILREMQLTSILSFVMFICSISLLWYSREKGGGSVAAGGQGRWKGKNIGLVVLSTLTAATFQASNNLDYLSLRTIWIYYGILFAATLLLYCFASTLWLGRVAQHDIATLVSVFCFVFVLTPTVQRFFKMYGASTVAFLALFLPSISYIALRGIKRANLVFFLSVCLLFAAFNFTRIDAVEVTETIPEKKHDWSRIHIKEEERASVFFLVYDAIPDLRTLGALGVDSQPLADLLQANDFKIYNDTYTIRFGSLESMGRTFQITDADFLPTSLLREACAGKGTSFQIFSQNGYRTCSIQGNYMTGGGMFTDEAFPRQDPTFHEFDSLVILLRGIFMGEFWFDLAGLTALADDSYHDFLRNVMSSKEGPWLTVMHVNLPGHAQNSGKLLPNETALFIRRLERSLPNIREDIRAIRTNNPTAVIVVLGDHGPYLTGDGAELGGYAPEDITELMVRDRFGTLVAIHWSDRKRAEKYDQKLKTNQDIFPVVLAYLADSPEPLDLMIRDKRAIMKGHAYLNEGEFAPYSKGVLLQ